MRPPNRAQMPAGFAAAGRSRFKSCLLCLLFVEPMIERGSACRIAGIQFDGPEVVLEIQTRSGSSYRIEWTETLGEDWTPGEPGSQPAQPPNGETLSRRGHETHF